ncbi:MAG TPA: hypothetical protein VMJ10_30200 [Kofleriaceae bacterium]|nr:hypothetical protein [Kofleriaceae bacterium]
MQLNTHRLSERNPDRHAADVFCLDCLFDDLDRTDFGKEIAVLLIIDLKRLAAARAAHHGERHWIWRWTNHLLFMDADLISIDRDLRAAAEQAQKTLCDYIVCWKSRRESNYKHARKIPAITERTRERLEDIFNNGGEPELFGHVGAN